MVPPQQGKSQGLWAADVEPVQCHSPHCSKTALPAVEITSLPVYDLGTPWVVVLQVSHLWGASSVTLEWHSVLPASAPIGMFLIPGEQRDSSRLAGPCHPICSGITALNVHAAE